MHADKPGEKKRWEEIVWRRHRYNDRTVIKSGSFLNCFCPHCGESLLRNQMVHLDTVLADGRKGWIELSPYLNVFERHSDIRLPPDEEIADLKCSSCRVSLKVTGRFCGRDGAHVACLRIGISTARVPFYFCMREGCHWHCLDPDDEHQIMLDESLEW